ncbi:hypothetical protein N0V84_004031 [Fusarium piperis]|uniref:Uncharacterized protein n=1 Tax=Fusarium piperis TaxID=1435070 RepID=A0A9W8WG96_9HYPO|nr:hypothetical protein N0V84_004031 [Fusarium piperis]
MDPNNPSEPGGSGGNEPKEAFNRGFPGSLPTPSTSSSERTRRRMQSSSGDSEPHVPGKPILVAKYRVACPVLRPTPLVACYGGLSAKLQSCRAAITNAAERILDNHNLTDEDITDVAVLYRQKPYAPNTNVPTLFIINPWNENSSRSWPLAAREIVDEVDKILADAECDETLHVEMIAPERVRPKYISPAPSLPGLSQAWPELQSAIHQKLDTYQATRSYVTLIGLFRLGLSPSPSLNPITVYVSLEDDSDETQWGAISRHLESYLHSQGWTSFVVHLEHNVVDRCAFDLNLPGGSHRIINQRLKESSHYLKGDYQDVVGLGASLGAAQYLRTTGGSIANPSAGTLGCYIEIRATGSTTWQKFGLTNYHIMRPCLDGFVVQETKADCTSDPVATPEQIKADLVALAEDTPRVNSELWKADHRVFHRLKYNRPMTLESPARVKHNYTIWYLNTLIQKSRERGGGLEAIRAEKLEREKASKIFFFDTKSNGYGSVRMASGFARRTPERNHRLDWAVIEVNPSRIGENRLPTEEDWNSTNVGTEIPGSSTFGALLRHPSSSLKAMSLEDSVWKVGATSGPTHGVYNEYKVYCKMKDDRHVTGPPRYSEQFVITGNDTSRFCGPGDSGAVVFNAQGEAIGLLFSGQRPDQSTAGYGLVTPIEDVFESIKACSSGTIDDIRIAEA